MCGATRVDDERKGNKPMLRILGRVCYGLSGASILLSLGSQFLMTNTLAKTRFLRGKTLTTPRSERLSIFFGLWAPTFAIVGKILEDAAREMELKQGKFGAIANNSYDTAEQQTLAAAGR